MGEMVKVQQEKIGEEVIQTVNARDLHEYLGIGRDFSSWIKERVDKYKFTEGKDYITCSPDPGSDVRVAHNRVEYHISLDMAKELSMVENNDKGRTARKYFIEAENKYRVVLTELEKSKMSAQIFMDLIKPNEATRLMLVHNICQKYGLPTDMIPQYAAGRVTYSMTALIKKFHVNMSAQAINKRLVEKGILAEISRASSTKGEKKFLAITEAGKTYGENLASPQNPRETQPHWYEDTFTELIKMVA